MSGQYKIMYSSMDQFYDQTNGRMAEWVSQLEPWVKACENLGNMECYQGKSAESVKTYLKEVHMTLLTSIQQAIQLYRTKYLFYREGYYDIEGDLYAVIPQKTLLSVKDRMKTEIEDVSDSSLIVQTSLLNVSDLIALQAPNSYYLKDSMEEVKQNVTDFNQNIIDYEAQHKSEANGELADLLQSLFATLTEYYTNGTNVTSYQSGDCFGNSHMPKLCQHVLTTNEYLKENAEEIELAEVKMQEVFAQQYEDACKAREEKGALNTLIGGVAFITGVLAIVGSGGMATPIVIGAWVTGGSTALYGASKAIEGIQDIHYGRTKNLTSQSLNFIRDTVFQGNQDAYDKWGELNMFVAGFCVPVGQTANKMAGAGKWVMAKQCALRVGKEYAKDKVSEYGAKTISGWAQEEYNLGKVETELLNKGIKIGLGKATEAAGQKLGVFDKPAFTDKMSFEDAKRYNGYWDDVKNGTHTLPDMSKADMKAWDLADQKVSEHIAVKKVDHNEVIKIRSEYAKKQENFLHPKTDADSAKTATFTNQEAEDLAFGAIKGRGKSDAVVLGKFEEGKSTSYDKIAQEYDAQYYNLDEWDELAKTHSRDEMWKVNEKFLDIEIASGRDIYLSHDPAKFSGYGSFFAKEIEYLRRHGYKFVKEGDLWHAVQ